MQNNITTQKKNQVVVFDIDSQGNVTQQLTENTQETNLENTLLPLFYPEIKVALVNVPMGFLDGFEESRVANAMARIECNGTVYLPVGSSSSAAKEGKFYLVDAAHAQAIGQRLQHWPEAAMHSFGILVSPCRALIDVPDVTVLVVKDGQLGTNDCRGWDQAVSLLPAQTKPRRGTPLQTSRAPLERNLSGGIVRGHGRGDRLDPD